MRCTNEMRIATLADNDGILKLFGAVPMRGELVLTTRRDPNFFALYQMQKVETECLVAEHEGEINLVATFLIREGWLDGEPHRLGYLGDLRTNFLASRRGLMARLYRDIFEELSQKHQCFVFLTSLLESNQDAFRALVKPRNPKRQQPYYHFLRRFFATSIQFFRQRKPKKSNFVVRTATESDLPLLVSFLNKDHQKRPFGYRFDLGEFEHRCSHWPEFSLEKTYLVFDTQEKLLACTTVWDPTPVKRYQVESYSGQMLSIKRVYNWVAPLVGTSKLPSEGNLFRYFYLCNTSVLDGNVDVFRALISQIYADFFGKGYHFFTFYLEDEDPLFSALKGFFVRKLPFCLYAVSEAKSPRTSFSSERTGFEIALA